MKLSHPKADVYGPKGDSAPSEALARVLRDWLGNEDRLYQARESCRLYAASSLSGEAFYDQFSAMISDRWPAERGRW